MSSKITIKGNEINIEVDEKWKELYKEQIKCISTWIDKNAEIDTTYKNPNDGNTKDSILFDDYLRGKNVAGIGQGRFTNQAKKQSKIIGTKSRNCLKK